ncbi:unnamed protein product, partial [Vitis vinifera]|uniref:Uncharacterized protein n=1 Tax=Vitis vinifera TaxID=29760 RepID=D7TSD9_VITVI
MKKLRDIDEYIRSHLDVSKLQMIRNMTFCQSSDSTQMWRSFGGMYIRS